MPHVNGLEGLKLIKKQFPEIKILMQTIFEDEDKIFSAIAAGADGYILKKTPTAKLLEAIKDVAEGGSPMTPTVARQVLLLFNNKRGNVKKDFHLTSRELEILSFLVKGYSYKMIADKCAISYPTVNTHISTFMKNYMYRGVQRPYQKLLNLILRANNTFKLLFFEFFLTWILTNVVK